MSVPVNSGLFALCLNADESYQINTFLKSQMCFGMRPFRVAYIVI